MVATTAADISEAIAFIRDLAGEDAPLAYGQSALRTGYALLTQPRREPLQGFQRARLCRALAALEDGLRHERLRGSALDLAEPPPPCPACAGFGSAPGRWQQEPCPSCLGTGEPAAPVSIEWEGRVYHRMEKQGTLRDTGEACTEYRYADDRVDARVYRTAAGRVVSE